jgi:hypothetical protein
MFNGIDNEIFPRINYKTGGAVSGIGCIVS